VRFILSCNSPNADTPHTIFYTGKGLDPKASVFGTLGDTSYHSFMSDTGQEE